MKHPQLLARIAGALYLVITACALFAYLYVRDQVINVDDMAQTGANFVAHEQLYRWGFAAALIVSGSGIRRPTEPPPRARYRALHRSRLHAAAECPCRRFAGRGP